MFLFPIPIKAISFAIPLQNGSWTQQHFDDIPANTVHFSTHTLAINVAKSAGLLCHRLKTPQHLQNISIEASIHGHIQIPNGKAQGNKETDDFLLRLALITQGNHRLSGFQKLFASNWIKSLYHLSDDSSIGKIRLYQLASHPLQAFNFRQQNPHFEQHIQWSIDDKEHLKLDLKLNDNSKIIAICLISDGDQTQSTFRVSIQKIVLRTQ